MCAFWCCDITDVTRSTGRNGDEHWTEPLGRGEPPAPLLRPKLGAGSDRASPPDPLSRRRIRDIDLNRVIRMERGRNRTILRLDDGTWVSIDHAGFTTSREAARFTQYLQETHAIAMA